ncbi:hypothetical protein FF2_022184 [Malus domestica]
MAMHPLLVFLKPEGHEASDSRQYHVVVSTWPFVEAMGAAWRAVDNGFSTVDVVVKSCLACEKLRCDGTTCWSLLSSVIPELGLTFRRIFYQFDGVTVWIVVGQVELNSAGFLSPSPQPTSPSSIHRLNHHLNIDHETFQRSRNPNNACCCYDIGISGGVTSMDSFLKKFFLSMYHKKEKDKTNNQYCQYDSQTLTMFTSSLYLATLISSIVAATMTRKFDQKLSMLFDSLLFCSGAIINAAAKAIWMLILGRMLLGFDIRFSNQVDYCFMVNAILDADISSARIVKKNGKTALHTAGRYGLLDIAKALIEWGPGIVCIKDKNGQTALHIVVKGHCTPIVEEILDTDSPILNERDKKGNTAVHIATKVKHRSTNSLLCCFELSSGALPSNHVISSIYSTIF